MNPYTIGSLPDTDPRLLRVLRDLAERNNQLALELELLRRGMPPVGAMKENPIEGILTIPPRHDGGQDGQIRVNRDGVIQSYVNPTESVFPYVDISTVGNITTGLDSLHSYTLKAGTLAFDGDYLFVRYGGTFATNDNDKRIRISFDGQEIHNPGLFDQDSGLWLYDIRYVRLTSTTIRTSILVMWNFGSRDGAGTAGGNYIFAGLTASSTTVSNLNTTDVVLLVQGEATATDDIQQTLSIIDLHKPKVVKVV